MIVRVLRGNVSVDLLIIASISECVIVVDIRLALLCSEKACIGIFTKLKGLTMLL